MSKLIDVDGLKKDILALQDCYNGFSDTYDKACIIGVIDEQPTIEPERKKGEWVDFSMSIKGVPTEACGECGEWSYGMGKNYCPNCGSYNGGEYQE